MLRVDEENMPLADNLATVEMEICPNPVFVIGSPRSGTSVLPWALAHHWDFWTSGETEFIHAFFDDAIGVYHDLRKKPQTFIPGHGVTHDEFLSALGLGINALISRYSEGKRWIDQSPGYTTMAWVLADMFPGSRFIHVLRDGRAVVNSMIHFGERPDAEHEQVPLQDWATDFEAAVRTWTHYVQFALDFCAQHPERTLTVRNEDLSERPEEEFEKILTFLEARQNAQPARFFRNSRVNSSFGDKVWGTEPVPEGISRKTPADAWGEWTPEQHMTFTEIAGDLMERLGYATREELTVGR